MWFVKVKQLMGQVLSPLSECKGQKMLTVKKNNYILR